MADEQQADAKPKEPTVVERVKAAPITFALTAINFAVFLWAGQPNFGDSAKLLAFGAVEPIHVWVGEYWRVATCMFLHIGWVHIGMNTYMAIGWASTLERAIGKWRFLLLYLLAGIAGGCASALSGLIFEPHVGAGASGALFGVIGAMLALRRRRMPSFAVFVKDPPVRSILIQLGLWTAVGFALHLDNAAHGGGFVAGATMAWLFTSRSARNGWLAFAVGLAALFVVTVRPWWSPSGELAKDIGIYARSYLNGTSPFGVGDQKPWPANIPRGVRFAEKGCSHGVARACAVLADHYDRTGEPAAKSEELRRKTCELDPGLCRQQE